MGILYFAPDIGAPSVLWMRRMLDGLGDDVSALVVEAEPPPGCAHRRTFVARDGASRAAWQAVRRLGLVASVPKTRRALRTVARALAADDVSAALVHYLTSAVLYRRVWERSAKPIFVHCHGWDVTWDMRHPDAPDVPVHPADYVENVRGLPEHVRFIANSRETAARLCEVRIDPSRIRVKHLGVPIPARPPRACEGPGAATGGRDELTILYLGRLVDCKGPELVIRAFDLACDRGLSARLVLAGDGPMRAACVRERDASRHADRVEILGAVDAAEGERLRARADVFAAHNRVGPLTRQREAFGVSLVEAMAAGIPVVTGRNGSVTEIVEDGVHGLLFEPGDVDAQADCFLRLAGDPALRRRLGRAGYARARDAFSIEREIAELRSILALDGPEEGA